MRGQFERTALIRLFERRQTDIFSPSVGIGTPVPPLYRSLSLFAMTAES